MDSPLTEKGRSQATIVGKCLADLIGPGTEATLVVSPLGRAQETAALVATAGSYHSIVSEDRIREVSLGAWNGLSREEIDIGWPSALDGATPFDWHLRAPYCEPYDAAFARAQDWLSNLEGTIVAVSHALIGRIIRSAYLGLPFDQLVCSDASPLRIWYLSGGSQTSIRAGAASP